MPESIQEFVDSRSVRLRVDRDTSRLCGVKLLGLESRNGRLYRESALREAVTLYEGAKVNVNHPKSGPLSPRDYQDRIGVVREVRFQSGAGLFADLHYNPKHELAEQLVWDAEHQPENVGLSHNVLARTSRDGQSTVVESIQRVQSVDLVADPAATRGLFEDRHAATHSQPSERDKIDSDAIPWGNITPDQLKQSCPELVESLTCDIREQLDASRAKLDQLQSDKRYAARQVLINRLLEEYELPCTPVSDDAERNIVSDRFISELTEAADEDSVRKLVEERASLVNSARRWKTPSKGRHAAPVSREKRSVLASVSESVDTVAQFVRAVTR